MYFMSKLVGERFKEKPADCSTVSYEFLIRGGYIKHVCNGVYSLLPPALNVLHRIENIARDEMNKIGGQEVLLPNLMPKELWEESGRYFSVDSEMFRFKDRAARDVVLGMTHEEPMVALCRSANFSYNQLPFMAYQIQTKFRDEPRAKNGLIRLREFVMKDGYSFHADKDDLCKYYEIVKAAYFNFYKRIGLQDVKCVMSDSGMMGGKVAHEFQLISDAGEDDVVCCDGCNEFGNAEISVSNVIKSNAKPQALEHITSSAQTIPELSNELNVEPNRFMKAVVYKCLNDKSFVVCFIRGDYEIEECKLSKILQSEVMIASDEEIAQLRLEKGFIGAYNLPSGIKTLFDSSLDAENNLICATNEINGYVTGFDYSRDLKEKPEFVDIRRTKTGDLCTKCGKPLVIKTGVEVGNIFQLGDRYTKAMGMKFINADGKTEYPIMGCYGIGINRCLACIIEANHDARGPLWNREVTPYDVQICIVNNKNEANLDKAIALAEILENLGLSVLVDDRKVSAGVQFADADLIGAYARVVFGRKFESDNLLEVSCKVLGESMEVRLDEVAAKVLTF